MRAVCVAACLLLIALASVDARQHLRLRRVTPKSTTLAPTTAAPRAGTAAPSVPTDPTAQVGAVLGGLTATPPPGPGIVAPPPPSNPYPPPPPDPMPGPPAPPVFTPPPSVPAGPPAGAPAPPPDPMPGPPAPPVFTPPPGVAAVTVGVPTTKPVPPPGVPTAAAPGGPGAPVPPPSPPKGASKKPKNPSFNVAIATAIANTVKAAPVGDLTAAKEYDASGKEGGTAAWGAHIDTLDDAKAAQVGSIFQAHPKVGGGVIVAKSAPGTAKLAGNPNLFVFDETGKLVWQDGAPSGAPSGTIKPSHAGTPTPQGSKKSTGSGTHKPSHASTAAIKKKL